MLAASLTIWLKDPTYVSAEGIGTICGSVNYLAKRRYVVVREKREQQLEKGRIQIQNL